MSTALLRGSTRWPTRAEIQATLAPPEAAGEGGLRLADPDLPMLRDFVLHPYVGFVLNYERDRHELNHVVVDLPVNDLGFIGALPPTHASELHVVVGITGGSVAAELFLFSRDAILEELARHPRFAGKEIQLVSFALAGMKQPQQLMALAWLLVLGHHFDVVINVDGFNEVALPLGENAPVGVFPAYPRNWRGYAARALDEEALWYAGRLELSRRARERWRRAFSRPLLRHSSAALLIWHRLLRVYEARATELELALRRQLGVEAALDAQTRGPRSPAPSPERVVSRSVALWQAASLQMARLCQANGIAYWQFLQPNLFFPDTKPLSDQEASVAADYQSHRFGPGAVLGYPRLLEAGAALRAAGVRFVDLSRAFERLQETVYRDACCHYTERGYERLARRIAGAVTGGAGPS